jgi:hypothetical protein
MQIRRIVSRQITAAGERFQIDILRHAPGSDADRQGFENADIFADLPLGYRGVLSVGSPGKHHEIATEASRTKNAIRSDGFHEATRV